MTKEQLVAKIQECYKNGNIRKAVEYNNELNRMKKEEKQGRIALLRLSNYVRKQCAQNTTVGYIDCTSMYPTALSQQGLADET